MPTTIRNQKLFCLNCGESHAMAFPIPVSEMTQKMKAFDKLHKKCKPTWTEPVADQSKSVYERAMWWIKEGEQGKSSIAMWRCFMDSYSPNDQWDNPSDPDDFKRCYKLLQAIPEWKNQFNKLKKLSPQWNNLVDNWDKLTEMFEAESDKMYEFMQKLTK